VVGEEIEMTAVADAMPRVELNHVSAAQWAELLQQFEDATIYQTCAYGEVSWGAANLAHVVVRESDDVVGLAQVRILTAPLGTGVAYVRWAPLWKKRGQSANVANFEQVIVALKNEYAIRRGLLLRIVPHVYASESEAVLNCLRANDFSKNEELHSYRTFRVDLTPTLEEIRKRLDQKWRNQLNRAEKNGLTVREGEGSDLYDIFLRLYDEMYARKEFDTSVDPRQFGKLQQKLASDEKMRILICEKDGAPLSALVGSAMGDTCIYLLGATSNEGMKHKGSYLLQWRMLQWGKERGCKFYDLGGINPDKNPGVYHFKEGFGGEDSSLIGTFEYCENVKSRVVVKTAEWVKRTLRKGK
jgi:hypothetical protein